MPVMGRVNCYDSSILPSAADAAKWSGRAAGLSTGV
jgi:hypothetical protein